MIPCPQFFNLVVKFVTTESLYSPVLSAVWVVWSSLSLLALALPYSPERGTLIRRQCVATTVAWTMAASPPRPPPPPFSRHYFSAGGSDFSSCSSLFASALRSAHEQGTEYDHGQPGHGDAEIMFFSFHKSLSALACAPTLPRCHVFSCVSRHVDPNILECWQHSPQLSSARRS